MIQEDELKDLWNDKNTATLKHISGDVKVIHLITVGTLEYMLVKGQGCKAALKNKKDIGQERGLTGGPPKTTLVTNYEQIWKDMDGVGGQAFSPIAAPEFTGSAGSPFPTCFFPLRVLFHCHHPLFYLGATPPTLLPNWLY